MLTNNLMYALAWDVWNKCLKECEPKVSLDIGANEGGYIVPLLQSGFKVHAFEPVPDMFAKLKERYANNPDVVCNQLGMSDANGTLEQVTVLSAWTLGNPNSVQLSTCPSYVGKPYFNVQMIKLDDYIKENELKIGFVKLDVDGYEYRVLRGGEQFFRSQQPPILCELSLYVEKIGDSIEQFINFIFSLGYAIVSMDGKHIFHGWKEVQPYYPFNTSFDVMLMPNSWLARL